MPIRLTAYPAPVLRILAHGGHVLRVGTKRQEGAILPLSLLLEGMTSEASILLETTVEGALTVAGTQALEGEAALVVTTAVSVTGEIEASLAILTSIADVGLPEAEATTTVTMAGSQGLDVDGTATMAASSSITPTAEATLVGAGSNIVVNPGFEDYPTSPGAPPSWIDNSAGSDTFTRETGIPDITGSNALKITTGAGGGNGFGIRQDFAPAVLTPGVPYQAVARGRTGGAANERCAFFVFDVTAFQNVQQVNGTSGSQTFEKFSITFTPIANRTYRLICRQTVTGAGQATGRVTYWDDVELRRLEPTNTFQGSVAMEGEATAVQTAAATPDLPTVEAEGSLSSQASLAVSAETGDFLADKDTYAPTEVTSDDVNHDNDQLRVSSTMTVVREAFIGFDVSNLPAGATVTAAELVLQASTTPALGCDLDLHEIADANEGWSETTLTRTNRPASAANNQQVNFPNGTGVDRRFTLNSAWRTRIQNRLGAGPVTFLIRMVSAASTIVIEDLEGGTAVGPRLKLTLTLPA